MINIGKSIRVALTATFIALHCYPVSAEKTESKGSSPPVKMSRSKICHDRSSSYYERTKHFTAYSDMAECIAGGGRRPKR